MKPSGDRSRQHSNGLQSDGLHMNDQHPQGVPARLPARRPGPTRPRFLHWQVPVLAGVLVLGLTACVVDSGGPGLTPGDGGDGTGDSGSDLAGRTLVSTGVTGHELVEGSTVRMSFEADQVSIQAGCNNIFGAYAVEGGTLQVNALGQTEMACAADLMAQDQWLISFLQSGPELTETADGIVLAGGGVELELTDREVADPDVALEGPTWVLNTAHTATADTNIRGMENASLVFEDGNVRLNTGCNTGGGSYTLDGDSLTLGPLRQTLRACDETAMEIESLMTAVLNQMDLTVEIEASTLKLTAPDGTALGFVADAGGGDQAEETSAP